MRAEPAVSTVLEARGLQRRHARRRGQAGGGPVAALDGVDLRVRAGALQALVGASGSGKSTLSRCLAGLETPDAGVVLVEGNDLACLGGRALRERRRAVQLIFQDPATSLNPRFRAWDAVSEPLAVRGWRRAERRARAAALMEEVGLTAGTMDRRVPEFSGGQRQRLAIARALAAEPSVLILDESLTGLDASTQAQVLNLLHDLREVRQLACLLVSHDAALVTAVAAEVAVMHEGRIVEQGTPAVLLGEARHPATRALLGLPAPGPPFGRRAQEPA